MASRGAVAGQLSPANTFLLVHYDYPGDAMT